MAWDPSSDIPLRGSHAPRVVAGESRAEAATRRVESASATAAADEDGPDLLGRAVEHSRGRAVPPRGRARILIPNGGATDENSRQRLRVDPPPAVLGDPRRPEDRHGQPKARGSRWGFEPVLLDKMDAAH